MGKTYVYIRDDIDSAPSPSNDTIQSFNVYNEAMSYAKWFMTRVSGSGNAIVFVWNYDGGSGYWANGSNFTPQENANYPS